MTDKSKMRNLRIFGDEEKGYVVQVKTFNFWSDLTCKMNDRAEAELCLEDYVKKGYG